MTTSVLVPAVFTAMLAATVGCGDNLVPEPQECQPTVADLPSGLLSDPYFVFLPDCVPGGLVEIPGRWFVSAAGYSSVYGYPAFDGDCDDGYWMVPMAARDDDFRDGYTFATWTDGTRIVQRIGFGDPTSPNFEAYSFAACVVSGDRLAAAEVGFNASGGSSLAQWSGTRFSLRDPGNVGLRKLASIDLSDSGLATGVTVEGSVAYVSSTYGLDVIDVATPTAPQVRSHYEWGPLDVRVALLGGRTILFVALGFSIDVVDVSDPSAPVSLVQLPTSAEFLQLSAEGATTYLYAAGFGTISVFDVTSPVAVTLVGARVTGAPIRGIAVDPPLVYATSYGGVVTVFDTSAGIESAVIVKQVSLGGANEIWVGYPGGRRVILVGESGTTGSSSGMAYLRVLDGDPASPTYMNVIGHYQSRPEVGVAHFRVQGKLVYVGYHQDGLRVVDLSDPRYPTEIAHYNTFDLEHAGSDISLGARDVEVMDDVVYVADAERGVVILQWE